MGTEDATKNKKEQAKPAAAILGVGFVIWKLLWGGSQAEGPREIEQGDPESEALERSLGTRESAQLRSENARLKLQLYH
eukprot:6065585-Amphidinium_carterae.1